ncbi:hypothetical protein HK096_008496, partial [Nowakowskiella sp. JEL0078]
MQKQPFESETSRPPEFKFDPKNSQDNYLCLSLTPDDFHKNINHKFIEISTEIEKNPTPDNENPVLSPVIPICRKKRTGWWECGKPDNQEKEAIIQLLRQNAFEQPFDIDEKEIIGVEQDSLWRRNEAQNTERSKHHISAYEKTRSVNVGSAEVPESVQKTSSSTPSKRETLLAKRNASHNMKALLSDNNSNVGDVSFLNHDASS